jgi:hypothetical protein
MLVGLIAGKDQNQAAGLVGTLSEVAKFLPSLPLTEPVSVH